VIADRVGMPAAIWAVAAPTAASGPLVLVGRHETHPAQIEAPARRVDT
jgi:hypothetical protein